MPNKQPRQVIPSVPCFTKRSDSERRIAYMKAFKSLYEGKAPRPEARRNLLDRYIEIAGWDEESIRTMQSAALTPVHQK